MHLNHLSETAMKNPRKTTKLDQRIRNDLREYREGRISVADKLSRLIVQRQLARIRDELMLSERGVPKFFFGNRSARTVLVMLNPGENRKEANRSGDKARKEARRCSLRKQILSYNAIQTDAVGSDDHPDSFDLKQAAFLKYWPDSGVKIPGQFPKAGDLNTRRKAAKNVLQQKLQLELIPYSSRHFDPGIIEKSADPELLKMMVSFLEVVLDEIGAKKRKYVVFCSKVFEPLFKAYEKNHRGTFTGLDADPAEEQKHKNWNCRAISIHYKDHVQPALIAHTFPSYGLSCGGKQMVEYGRFCFASFSCANARSKRKQRNRRKQ